MHTDSWSDLRDTPARVCHRNAQFPAGCKVMSSTLLGSAYGTSSERKWHFYGDNLNQFKFLNNLQTSGLRLLLISKLLVTYFTTDHSTIVLRFRTTASDIGAASEESSIGASQAGFQVKSVKVDPREGRQTELGQRHQLGCQLSGWKAVRAWARALADGEARWCRI